MTVTSADSGITQLAAAVPRTAYLLSWPFAGVWWALLLQAPWVLLTGR